MSPITKSHAPRTWCHNTIAAALFLLLLLAGGGWAGWNVRQSATAPPQKPFAELSGISK
ncbi:MAG: hypothetical protein ABGZ23_17870 [Fuerstiella sp.]